MKTLNIAILNLLLIIQVGCKLSSPLSPGELANVHAFLEGSENCTMCHNRGSKISDSKCLECHNEINARIADNRGYHSSPEVQGKNCTECHSDHHGKDFDILHFDSLNFDHSLTGYLLAGSHSSLNCYQCHHQGFIQDTSLLKKNGTFLGLGNSCIDCHNDYHLGELGNNCGDCHDQVHFVPASNFNHQGTSYPLKGKHLTTECFECHIIRDEGINQQKTFAGLEFDNCSRCHTDVHKNRFGNDCASCHTEESFHKIMPPGDFNHELAGFKLKGKHSTVNCEACHGTDFNPSLQHGKCLDCHKDHHKGIFKENGKTKDCAYCHNETGFTKTIYSVKQHNSSQFPLTGAHQDTECTKCHMNRSQWQFRNIGKDCQDCHSDIHNEFISKEYLSNGCLSCHNTTTWDHIAFNHSSTGYDLAGAHSKKNCRDCHFGSGPGIQGQRFKTLNRQCTQCHQDIHFDQFKINGDSDCLRCHSYSDWQPSVFNHDQTNFPLDGRHKNVACIKCHPQLNNSGISYYQYKLKKYACADCHSL